jgi:aryl-alcohol dehydrogenase-like predicted oxidoreductase
LSFGELPLIGARKVSQLQESLKALDKNLSESDLKRIADAVPVEEDNDMVIKLKNGMIVRERTGKV